MEKNKTKLQVKVNHTGICLKYCILSWKWQGKAH